MRAMTARLLNELANLYPCVVISGRAQADVRSRLGAIPVQRVIGNHGVEPWQASGRLSAQVKRWRLSLERRLKTLPGVKVEDKTYSIAVHYRHSREKAKARSAIARAVSALDGARVIGGKQVVNVLPRTAHDKGMALLKERARLRCDTAIYVGDDDTDEDVFALADSARVLTIRIGARSSSAASYSIRRQSDIDRLLGVLVGMRQKSPPVGKRKAGQAGMSQATAIGGGPGGSESPSSRRSASIRSRSRRTRSR